MKTTLLVLALGILSLSGSGQTKLLSSGANWKYLDDGSNPGSSWYNASFNDASWKSGPSELGYGDNDEATTVSYGSNASAKHVTTYFRTGVSIPSPSSQGQYTLQLKRDDGIIVYINGKEVYRDNMPAGPASSATYASGNAGDDGATWLTAVLSHTVFVTGNNVIAAEIHQSTASSSDITFDLELLAGAASATNIKEVRWGSSGDPLSGLTVTWNNSVNSDSIRWGYTTGFEMGAFKATPRAGNGGGFFNKYVFPAVTPASDIYYQLYDGVTSSWGSMRTFHTAPASSDNAFTFLGMGDSRSGLSVWNQVSSLAHSKGGAFTLFNGDVVNTGSSLSDWTNWFSSGKQFIENQLIYHSLGNHDISSNSYYANNFDLPQVNGSNLYYSFTYGNALFICLNSEDPSNSAQTNWLISTLQAHPNVKWKIAFFHRPFYTIGSHAGEMNAYFSTWWKAFDDYGVDLVLNGHDHMYERTKPINRKVSTTAHVPNYGSGPQEGRCQIVCGGAGAPLYSGSPTWFIEKYSSKYNFCRFEVMDCKIRCTVFDNNNAVLDTFSLNKCLTGVNESPVTFHSIRVHPNPVAGGSFGLDYESDMTGEGTLHIYDLQGKEVFRREILKEEKEVHLQVQLPSVPAGTYHLEVRFGSQSDNILLIVK